MNNSAIQRPQNEDNAERNSSNGSHNLSHSDPTVNGGAKLSIRSAMPEDVVYSRNNEEGIRTLLGGPNSHEYSESPSTPKILPHSDPAINGSAKLSISPQMAERDKKAKEAIVSLGNELNTSGAGYVSDEGEIRFSLGQYNRIGREKLTAYLNNPKNNVDPQERERILTGLDGMARLMESMRGDYARFSKWQDVDVEYDPFQFTPALRRATVLIYHHLRFTKFQFTPALRRATWTYCAQ